MVLKRCHTQCCGSGSGAFLTPGSGMNNPNHISESLETIFFWFKILNYFDADPGWKKSDPQHWSYLGKTVANINLAAMSAHVAPLLLCPVVEADKSAAPQQASRASTQCSQQRHQLLSLVDAAVQVHDRVPPLQPAYEKKQCCGSGMFIPDPGS
jgi:hypothetical protein